MSNELEVVSQMNDLAMSRAPEVVLAEAQKAAAALKEVISKKSKPVIMNGEQYLEYEDWQTVGHFYGLKVKTGDAMPVEINGVHGAKAHAVVIDLHSGREIGGAEAYCLRDERNWESKPWFQLASMAQTRAGSKSLRNVLAWVVVLAGYKPTPAEEMANVFEQKPKQVVSDPKMVTVDRYTGEPIRQEVLTELQECKNETEDAFGIRKVDLGTSTPKQASDSHAPKSAADYCDEQAKKAGTGEQTAEGYIGNHTPRLAGKTAPPGRFVLETLHGELELQYWNRPDGIGTPNHSYAKVTYRVSQRGKFTNNELLKLDWAAPPQ